ncbi:MAG: long-chain fatty acid--CoA ligase, partial [Alphaproteobacteria bacterium]|nr:long-chain fatty acid--CoA ligase [Alphaproteobacteria bacterium]
QADELAYLVADARPEVLIFGADLAGIVAKAAASFPVRPALFGLRGEASGAASLEKTLERASDAPPRIAVDPASAAALMYTSGTTGKPKGVLFPHASYFATYLALIVEGDLDPGAVTMVNIPLFHQAGMNALALPTLMMGGTVVLTGRNFDPIEAFATVARHRVTTTMWVPTMLGALSMMSEVRQHDLASLKAIWYGSAPITPTVLERSLAAFPAAGFHQWYGQTETGMVSILRPEDHRERSQFTGREVFNAEIRIVDSEGRDVAPGGTGEVLCEAAQGMIGYLNNPEATAKTVIDGWIHTGDIARVEEGGYFTIVDRSRDVIISGAENIYPKEIENVIAGHPVVLEVAVFGIPDEKWGEAVCAAVVLRPGASADAGSIIAHCAERLARYKKPSKVDFLETLPKNSMGKVTKNTLRDPYWAGRGRRI